MSVRVKRRGCQVGESFVWGAMGGSVSSGSQENGVRKCCDSCQQVAGIVLRGVAAGKTVEIDGLGSFYPDARRGFRFVPRALPQVFIAYGKEDELHATRL